MRRLVFALTCGVPRGHFQQAKRATPGYLLRSFSTSFFSSSGVIFKPELASYDALLEAKSFANSPPAFTSVVDATTDLVPSFW